MDNLQKAIIASLLATSAIAWIASSVWQSDNMMLAMATYSTLSISLFTASWTAGMAAMMFPAIVPMVLLYSRFVTNKENKAGQPSVTIQEESKPRFTIPSMRVILFAGCYLLVWAITGIALLLGWSVVMNNTIMAAGNAQLVPYIYGILLILAGTYQFTPLKKTCIGYCESPLSFFMRRWRDGTSGAVKMGLYHGMYCLGCCWPYFLLMVALGWMNLLWMGLFAGIIFGEKIWSSKGIWVARAAGLGLCVVGILVLSGMLPSLVSSASSMGSTDDSNMQMKMDDGLGNDDNVTMSNNTPNSSMGIQDGSEVQSTDNDELGVTLDKTSQSMQSVDSGNSEQMSDMKMN